MVHVDPDLPGKTGPVFSLSQDSRRVSWAGASVSDHAHLAKAVQDMLVQDRIAGESDVPEKVARFLIPQAL